jgi:hypothetical protein
MLKASPNEQQSVAIFCALISPRVLMNMQHVPAQAFVHSTLHRENPIIKNITKYTKQSC